MAEQRLSALLIHKCSEANHALGAHIKRALEAHEVTLLIDPFRPGDDIETRMDTFGVDAFVSIASDDTYASPACLREIEAARRYSKPLFFVGQPGGCIPPTSRQFEVLELPLEDDPNFRKRVADFAAMISARVHLERDLNLLRSDATPSEAQNAAQRLALETDPSLLATEIRRIANQYLTTPDPTTRYWIALALGAAGTSEAAELLSQLPQEDHPYALEGLKQALEMIREQTPGPHQR